MQLAHDGDLVLMDAGNEFYGYCSDLTRTWPVSGAFSPQQRDVYEVVRDTHRSAKHPLLWRCTPSVSYLALAMHSIVQPAAAR